MFLSLTMPPSRGFRDSARFQASSSSVHQPFPSHEASRHIPRLIRALAGAKEKENTRNMEKYLTIWSHNEQLSGRSDLRSPSLASTNGNVSKLPASYNRTVGFCWPDCLTEDTFCWFQFVPTMLLHSLVVEAPLLEHVTLDLSALRKFAGALKQQCPLVLFLTADARHRRLLSNDQRGVALLTAFKQTSVNSDQTHVLARRLLL
ncbi:hypothetical protein Bca4012_067458 [Brassica carinata]